MINVRDTECVRALRPFLVAHRGGVITPDSPENSRRAIELAAQHGYAMVEVDVMETRDGEPVLLHDGLYINCGVKQRICDLTRAEVTAIRYRASEETVMAFADAVELCAKLGLGLMLDKLCKDDSDDRAMSDKCLRRVAGLIREAGLGSSTVAIVDTPALRERLQDVVLFPIRPADVEALAGGRATDLSGEFWFGWAAELSASLIAKLERGGSFAVVSINTFHYPHHAPDRLAREDIERLVAAGTEGFQIDSAYEGYVKSAPIREVQQHE
jgi:hypothetical protein